MKLQTILLTPIGTGLWRIGGAVVASTLFAASALAAGSVKAPPLPPGSALVKVKAGQSPEEEQRAERAHKHKVGKTDPTGDKQGSKS